MFGTGLASATFLPFQSEVLLVALMLNGAYDLSLLLAAATLGNTLGSVVNWLLGRFLMRYVNRRWFPLSPQAYERAARFYQRYGVWSLLLSWAPFVGDPLTFVAGMFRTDLWRFVAIVLVAKGGRYLFVVAATFGWLRMGDGGV
jgi:membrane protein YqaA with SNARE-associated domain